MAPYAIAHLKLGLELQELGYQFKGKQRLGIYLTNTLDEALKKSEILFGQFVAQEANEASIVKRDTPVMVVLGNPPYSGTSANKSTWISGLIKDYYYVDGLPLGERNPKWLQDDYVKFIRFGQWRVSETGYGVLAFITNHGYLNNPTFRGMRQNLMQTFTDIYVLDLHGNSKKKEISPDGSPDQNVFDIQQGVSIGIFIKEPGKETPAKVHHAELWGDRTFKYEALNQLDINKTKWIALSPCSPDYLFIRQDSNVKIEYGEFWLVTKIFPVNALGFQTHRDHFAIDFSHDQVKQRLQEFRGKKLSNDEIRSKYELKDNRDWNVESAREQLRQDENWEKWLVNCLYRPFDLRSCYFNTVATDYPRTILQQHMTRENLSLLCSRQQATLGFHHAWCADAPANDCVMSTTSREANQVFPLYLYPDNTNQQTSLFIERTPNFSSQFLSAIREKLGYVPTPEAIFYYIYAIFHSPTYRDRYAEFLKGDFPRVPLTSSDQLFKDLGAKGEELVALHLMKSKKLNNLITKMGGDGDNAVTEVTYKPTEQRIYINKTRYFEGIAPEVWNFKIGGYQVLDKWLKDRKKAKRTLSFDDVLHYQKVVVALKETMQTMQAIDELIPSFPIE